MLVSESWLKEWVQSDLDAKEISEKLTLAGLEVEGIEPASGLNLSSANSKKLVVGEILSVSAHPDADRLKICKVDAGRKAPLTIVCGAANAAAGKMVPVALPGAKIPGVHIKKSTIRGVESSGMLCSASELGLADQSAGLLELDPEAVAGTLLAEHLKLDDTVFDIDLTPNRGDCLCVMGIGREVSALTGATLKQREVAAVKAVNKNVLSISLEAPQACARFVGRTVHKINMHARTPDWMREKLRRSGLRSINPVVDITNFVMMETGQPMHAYDLDKLSGGIVVRMARQGENLKLLDGNEIKLTRDNLVISDELKAVGLAGIMGGDNTAISDSTINIFFEAAFFSPGYIIGKARHFGMHTDASHRFERGVNPEGQQSAVELATMLLLQIAGGEPGKICHSVDRKSLPKRAKIDFERSEIARMLGITVPAPSVKAILCRLGMQVEPFSSGWKVVPPPWRFDISGAHDLVEEVGRCYGYEKVAPRMPTSEARSGRDLETVITPGALKKSMTDRGYFEVINYSFIDPSAGRELLETAPGIMLANPIADNMAEMRQSLIPGLISSLSRNLNRQESMVKLFECGNVFLGKGKKRQEVAKIAGLICGSALPRQWSDNHRQVDFFDIKGDVETLLSLSGDVASFIFERGDNPLLHPGRSASITRNRKVVGYIGQLHPVKQNVLDIALPVFLFEMDQSALSHSVLPQFKEISRYPAVQRDISVVVGREVAADRVLEVVNKAAGNHLKSLELFDIYAGERVEINKKSFAFSLTFQSESSSLTSADIDAVTNNIIMALQDSVGAELRT